MKIWTSYEQEAQGASKYGIRSTLFLQPPAEQEEKKMEVYGDDEN